MPPAMLPTNELERLAALRALDILDTPSEALFDSFVRVAAAMFDVPISSISLIDDGRQWFKSAMGLPRISTPRADAFCAHAILDPDNVFCVPDARKDPRFADNALVKGAQSIRFYAGAAIFGDGALPIGALNVMSPKPRVPTPSELARLKDLAMGVSAAVRLHGLLRRAERDASLDRLTGLGNRRAFEQTLTARAPDGITLYLLDLDNFKAMNNLFGHPGGDLALREAAQRLTAVLVPGMQVFRLAADEFAVLAPRLVAQPRLAVAASIHQSLHHPVTIDGQAVPLRASIGMATLPDDAGQPAALIHVADVALYEAKRKGRGMTQAAQPIDAGVPRWSTNQVGIGRMGLMQRLRDALIPPGHEPFTLVFQPVVSLETGQTESLEALVRWQLGPTTTVSPVEFVTLAERIGLVAQLDRWVLTQACRLAAGWPQPWRVSVNVSSASFGLVDVPAMVTAALAASRLPPDRLILEMTETALAGDLGQAQRAVVALRTLGVGVALDDFGAGHGTLTTLRQFPFTELKLDRDLIAGVSTDRTQEQMVAMVGQLGRALGVPVVAEGVETAAMLRAVLALGATLAQGYILSRPVPNAAVPEAVAGARRVVLEAFAAPVAAIEASIVA